MTEQPPAIPLPGQASVLNRMNKNKLWQAIPLFEAQKASQNTPFESGKHPGTNQGTPWLGVTEQPPAIPLPGPNDTPEPNEKIKPLAGNSTVPGTETPYKSGPPGTETKPQDILQIRETIWRGATEQPPAVPLPGLNVAPEPNEKIQVLATVPSTETKPQDILRITETPWHGVTEQPPAIPLPGPNVTPAPNEKNQGSGWQFHSSRQSGKHLAWRDGTASYHPSAQAKRHS